jgi:U3 small nucleolar RNA-associated protein 20
MTVKQGLRSKEDFARREVINLLSKLVHAYSHHPKFTDLACLLHSDPEADFFLNVRHIQLHRRTRAYRKLSMLCSEGHIGQASCLAFLLPLANHVVFAPSTNTEQNLITEAVNVVGGVSKHLSWNNYSFILGHYLRQLSKSKDFQKNLIK